MGRTCDQNLHVLCTCIPHFSKHGLYVPQEFALPIVEHGRKEQQHLLYDSEKRAPCVQNVMPGRTLLPTMCATSVRREVARGGVSCKGRSSHCGSAADQGNVIRVCLQTLAPGLPSFCRSGLRAEPSVRERQQSGGGSPRSSEPQRWAAYIFLFSQIRVQARFCFRRCVPSYPIKDFALISLCDCGSFRKPRQLSSISV